MSSDIPFDAIRKLVGYLADEQLHFEGMQEDGEDTSNHIYNSVKIVSDWLDEMTTGDNDNVDDLAELVAARVKAITTAYESALAGRDASTVDIFDVLPAIYKAVPGVSDKEIIAALESAARRSSREADALERKLDRDVENND